MGNINKKKKKKKAILQIYLFMAIPLIDRTSEVQFRLSCCDHSLSVNSNILSKNICEDPGRIKLLDPQLISHWNPGGIGNPSWDSW